jgi:hypothetical protein
MIKLKALSPAFSVCKVTGPEAVDFSDPYCFIGKTDEEFSLVCTTVHAPAHTLAREDGWRAFRVQGPLDFFLIGILSRLSGILAQAQIGIFAVSTYNTDYILVRQDDFARACKALESAGYAFDA